MEGIPEVEKIMGSLWSHIKEGADPKTNMQHYNYVYNAIAKLIVKDKQPLAGEFTASFRELLDIQCVSDALHIDADRNEFNHIRSKGYQACDRLDRQAEENERQSKHIQKLEKQLGLCKDRFKVKNLQAENKQLKKALRKYGVHRYGCDIRWPRTNDMSCTCGYDQALKEAEGE